ncbi:MAG: hypothetical protein Q9160_007835 [Pyrenula sp. 1 TL-2023]
MPTVSSTSVLVSLFLCVTLSTVAVIGDGDQFPLQKSANPGLGVNLKAKGATAAVTPTTGPNGWASGDRNGIDPVFLAFIAMQESSCDANAGASPKLLLLEEVCSPTSLTHTACTGGPTPGLMQVACSNYPDGKCTKDVAKNVEAGTKYLRKQLDESNNNALKAIGNYNGWFTAKDGTGLNGGKGLTEKYPCSKEGKNNGQPQNLDYLHQTING